jgi:hypothetical protein
MSLRDSIGTPDGWLKLPGDVVRAMHSKTNAEWSRTRS